MKIIIYSMKNQLNYLKKAIPFAPAFNSSCQWAAQTAARKTNYGSWKQNLITLFEVLYISTWTPVGFKAFCRGSKKRRWVKVGACAIHLMDA